MMLMKRRPMTAVLFLLAITLTGVHGVKLDESNFEEMTAGKMAFLKFYDPMCGNCQKLEPAWNELGEAFATSKSKLIGEIDCTNEAAKSICEQEGIASFPKFRWGRSYDLQEYGGPRDFKNLKKFADKQLKPDCDPTHTQLCDKATRKEIRRLQKLSVKALDAEIVAKLEELNTIEWNFKKAMEDLEQSYEQANKKKEADRKNILDSGLGLMKAVVAKRKEEL